MDQAHIRNFSIIAHIDHGKSTLADRLLEYTGTLSPRQIGEQVLDQMPLERERGVTIKASAVRMLYRAEDGHTYQLNLLDTPGHVDFSYEVSRALAAVEGAILVVDASQGIEAQTLANLHLAREHRLAIIPVANKIDLPAADPDRVAAELETLLSISAGQVIRASAKEGIGTAEILEAVIARNPPPGGDPQAPLRALIFDSHYDSYKGVVSYIRVVDGRLAVGQRLLLMAKGRELEPLEVGIFRPDLEPIEQLEAGEVGYVATGLKEVREVSVGDTLTEAARPAAMPLPGYRPVKPMVFAGFYPAEGADYTLLRDALEKLRLNDAALSFQPENSQALGFGFRCGFLGLFHMEIVQERLEREYGLNLLATAPNVEYQVRTRAGEEVTVRSPAELPTPGDIEEIREPWMNIKVFSPVEYIGPCMDLVTSRRGQFEKLEYLDERRVLLTYQMPLAELIVDFYDQLKSRSRGYASLDYELIGYRPADLVKLEILVNQEPVDALSMIVHRDQAYARGNALVERLSELIPRQLFSIPIQAAVGSRVIARETIPALRKNVLAKCYGGDVTRKRKLLEKQKAGKKRLKKVGRVEIPQEAFLALLKLGDTESSKGG
ncbi:MAG: elongation factor 4 [Chloroflexi bacterium]|nr:elongation factor 4 [Chloroflexota bacterium]